MFAIKKRITAAKQTRKITSTMELIASSRLQRGKQRLLACQAFAKHMREAARYLPDSYFEPLTASDTAGQNAYVVLGGSKGLSGAYAPNLFQYAAPIVKGHIVLAVGSATEAFFPDAHSRFGDEAPSADGAGAIAAAAKALFDSKTVREVYLLYMRGTRQISERLLPPVRMGEHNDRCIIVPSEKQLFPKLFEAYLETILYEAHLHAFIAEQIARISAMDSATQNADEIIKALESTYNQIRQSGITQEIIMVSNAARGGGV